MGDDPAALRATRTSCCKWFRTFFENGIKLRWWEKRCRNSGRATLLTRRYEARKYGHGRVTDGNRSGSPAADFDGTVLRADSPRSRRLAGQAWGWQL